MALAREKALKHAGEQLSRDKGWLQGLLLQWEIKSAKFDEDEDCYKVILLCYPEDADVAEKAQWEYHIDAKGNLYAGTPMLITKGKWVIDQPEPEITDPTPPDQISTLEMVSIPGGSFQMGDLSGDGEPVHTVTLSPFSMARYEITCKQWQEVKNWAESHGYTFNIPGDMGSDDGSQDATHPVTGINWYDAVKWCNALSEMEGRTPCYYTSSAQTTMYRSDDKDIQNDWVKWNADGYRLPTEAEWEYACRAGTTTKYSFGNSINSSDANYDQNENGTTPIGLYSPNNWGLYDMHGNVWEWCWDWYDSSYYDNSSSNNPRGPSAGSRRVIRGGSWYYSAGYLLSAYRDYGIPDRNGIGIGFRPVSSQ